MVRIQHARNPDAVKGATGPAQTATGPHAHVDVLSTIVRTQSVRQTVAPPLSAQNSRRPDVVGGCGKP